MTQANSILFIPILAGILLFLIPGKTRTLKGILTVLVSLWTVYAAFVLHGGDGFQLTTGIPEIDKYGSLRLDSLSGFIVLCISILSSLISIYTLKYNRTAEIPHFHAWFLLTLGFSYGAVLANNLLLFLVCWGILGISLFMLIRGRDEAGSAAAKKSLVLIGASDGIMIIGVAIVWRITGTLDMDKISVHTDDTIRTLAFLALLAGSFTKAGAFPLHTWVPDFAQHAPANSSAFLPASLDKLLGIYFLARITTDLFVMGDWIRFTLLTLGVITIITAVMMALVQHDFKRLLGFHAVSQVGYMILGFGMGSAIGIAAGLFHMLNNAIYKGGLFLSSGAVEQQSGKSVLEDLGGLSSRMPWTFAATVVFALSISGIPPLNGFASKWMIYQGLIDFGQGSGVSSQLWMVWLGLAVLGSALTLASFIKFLGGIFLGRRPAELDKVREASPWMYLPMILLALLCITLGVMASRWVPEVFGPLAGEFSFTGVWDSVTLGILVLVSILLGLLIYFIGNIRNYRSSDSFVGGEALQDEFSYQTPQFYRSFQEFRWLSWMYRKAREGVFDLYEISARGIGGLGRMLSRSHSGILHDYALWVFAGLLILLLILVR